MALVATEGRRYSDWVKFELEPSTTVCRSNVVVNQVATGAVLGGTVMGIVTATGKWRVSLAAAADGSQNFAGFLVPDAQTFTATTDARTVVLDMGPAQILRSGIIFDPAATAPQRAALEAQMLAKGIKVVDAF